MDNHKKNRVTVIIEWGLAILIAVTLLIGVAHIFKRIDRKLTFEYDVIYLDTGLTSIESGHQEPLLYVTYIDENDKLITLKKPYSQWSDTEKYMLPFLELGLDEERYGVVVYKFPFRNFVGAQTFEIMFD